jgi:pimeloyl-ACP methyl ester carboxylesterase
MKKLLKIFLKILLGLIALLLVIGVINYALFLREFNRWQSHPDPAGKLVTIDQATLFYKLQGSGSPIILLESGLGSSYTRWTALQISLSAYGTVLAYDRGGYGLSRTRNFPRTGESISQELAHLLEAEGLSGPKIVIGHSFGANQAVYDALNLPGQTLGVVLIDPGFYDSQDAITALLQDPRLGDKARQFVRTATGQGDLFSMQFFGTSGLLYGLFHLQGGGSQNENYILVMNASSRRYYQALGSEEDSNRDVFTPEEKQKLAPIPLVLITSNHLAIRDDLVRQGLTPAEAQVIADTYQQGKSGYLTLSAHSQLVEAQTGEHDVYRYEPELVLSAVDTILKEAGK